MGNLAFLQWGSGRILKQPVDHDLPVCQIIQMEGPHIRRHTLVLDGHIRIPVHDAIQIDHRSLGVITQLPCLKGSDLGGRRRVLLQPSSHRTFDANRYGSSSGTTLFRSIPMITSPGYAFNIIFDGISEASAGS